jgi:hypothetical protein
MKKEFKYILAVVCFFGIQGCTDLEEHPVGILAPEGFFKSVSDVEATIFSGYARISSESLYGRQFNGALQLRSDMVDIGDLGTPAERQQVNNFNVDANNGMVARWWPQFYYIVSTENTAIAGADQIEAAEEVKNRLKAEARFVRAFAYYHLVRLFGDIPYLEEMVTDPEAVKSLSKTPADQVYQKIIADLQFARENLPDQQPGDVRSRPTRGTAASYLASVYLTIGDYQKAAEEAQWVIANKSRFNYGLAADYQDLFNAEKVGSLNEPVFVIDYLYTQFNGPGGSYTDVMGSMTGVGSTAGGVMSLMQGWDVLVPSLKVYQTWSGRDYRKAVSLDTVTAFVDGTERPYTEWRISRPHQAKITRFPGSNADPNGNRSDHDYLLMRYAEVLLTAAEALTETNNGPTEEAIGYINEVRARARNWGGMMTNFPANVPAGLSKEEFTDLVLEERRLELCFEYKRWYDIKRRRLGEQVFKGSSSLEPHANFDPNRDYLFPIPGAEIARYQNLLPQNPGY